VVKTKILIKNTIIILMIFVIFAGYKMPVKADMVTVIGSLSKQEVAYWWVNSIKAGDLVLLNIQTKTFPWQWESRLYYSDMTLVKTTKNYDAHIYEFIANKTDNYLLRLYADFDLNYTIHNVHIISKQMTRYPSNISCIISKPEVNKGDAVTISGYIQPTVQGLVIIQYSMDNGLTWINLTSLTSSSDGSYSYSWSPTDISSYRVRSLWQGNNYYNGAISQEAPFTVKQQDYTIVAVAAVTGVTAVGVAAAYKAGIIGTTKTTTLLKVYAAGTITAEAAPKIKARYKAWQLSRGENNVTDEVLEAEFKKAENIHSMLREQGEKFSAEECAKKLNLDVMEVKKALEILQVEGFVKTGSPPIRETVPYRGT